MSQSPDSKEQYLVIGGAGFLGSYIVQALVDRGESSVAVFGGGLPIPAEKIPGVLYYPGDIQDEAQLCDCLAQVSPSVVFHTVSPSVKNKGLKETVYYDVNVGGTRIIINSCQKASVKALVYTSSTSVVWSGQQISGLNEDEVPIPDTPYSKYTHSKGLGEKMVLAANGVKGMKTVALRPPGMVGPRDRLSMWRLVQTYEKRQHKYQMGDNTNLVDYSYAGNIADAHLLAADKMIANASPDLVSGEAFFLSDGVPRPYWDFPRLVWKHLGDDGEGFVSLPRWICYVLAFLSEIYAKLVNRPPAVPRFTIDFATREQWYSIEKARKLLGYEPRVSFEDGVQMMVKWWEERGAAQYQSKMESKKTQ